MPLYAVALPSEKGMVSGWVGARFLGGASGALWMCLPVQCPGVDGAGTGPSRTGAGLRVLSASLLAVTPRS